MSDLGGGEADIIGGKVDIESAGLRFGRLIIQSDIGYPRRSHALPCAVSVLVFGLSDHFSVADYALRLLARLGRDYRPAPPATLPRQAIRTTVPLPTAVHLGHAGLIDATKNETGRVSTWGITPTGWRLR